jgi:glycosyltransferase involved in cell wall biosynthesis
LYFLYLLLKRLFQNQYFILCDTTGLKQMLSIRRDWMTTLWLVLPCYNEEEVLKNTATQLSALLNDFMVSGIAAPDSKIAFVDDGSTDATWPIIEKLYRTNPLYVGIKFSHNQGQQKALMAGMMAAKAYAEAVITLDVDLQDDIEAIEVFLEQYDKGYDVVYGVRSDRKSDGFTKRLSANIIYKLLSWINPRVISNHGDFRLMSRRVIDTLSHYQQEPLFIRGLVPRLGFSSVCVPYSRKKRIRGNSKYSIGKMLRLALDAVISLSLRPVETLQPKSYGVEVLLYQHTGGTSC